MKHATPIKVIVHRPDMFGPARPSAPKPLGLGDAIAKVATPIARAVGMDCIDPKTKQLRPESGCNKRKAMLNRAMPDVLHPLSPQDPRPKTRDPITGCDS